MSGAKDRFTLSEALEILDTIYVIPSNGEGSDKTDIASEYILRSCLYGRWDGMFAGTGR